MARGSHQRRGVVVVAAVLAVAFAGGARAEERDARALRIAVPDFEITGVDARIGKLVTQSVLVELRKLERTSVIGAEEIRAMLDYEASRQMAACGADQSSCLAELAGALGVDVLVTGTLARVGDDHVFGLRRIEQARAQVAGSVSKRLIAKDGEEFLAVVGPAVAELFPEIALRPGKSRGVDPELALRLNPDPLGPAWFWTGVGTSAAALGVTVLASGLWALSYVVVRARLDEGQERAIDYRSVQALMAVSNAGAAFSWGGVLVTTALAATAAALFPFTDFAGYRDDARALDEASAAIAGQKEAATSAPAAEAP